MRRFRSPKQQTIEILILVFGALGAAMKIIFDPSGAALQLGFLALIIYLSYRPPQWLLRLVGTGPVVYRHQPIKKLPIKKKRKFRVIDGNK